MLPSGITETIEIISNRESRKFNIPGLSVEDIKQEIVLECHIAMESFDPSRIGPSPYSYLRTCVRNKLYNMRRGVYVPNNPPCNRCALYDKELKCKIEEFKCVEMEKYKNSMNIKASIKSPYSIGTDLHYCGTQSDANLLDDDIQSILPKNLLFAYSRMINGFQKEVSYADRSKIRKIIREFLSDA